MGGRESTIRSHLKHMFVRHGLSRRAELVRLVLSRDGAPGSRAEGGSGSGSVLTSTGLP